MQLCCTLVYFTKKVKISYQIWWYNPKQIVSEISQNMKFRHSPALEAVWAQLTEDSLAIWKYLNLNVPRGGVTDLGHSPIFHFFCRFWMTMMMMTRIKFKHLTPLVRPRFTCIQHQLWISQCLKVKQTLGLGWTSVVDENVSLVILETIRFSSYS